MLRVGIVSYLPEDKAVREKRRAIIKEALSSIRSLLPEEVVVNVISQQYEECDFLEGATYENYEYPLGPGPARNLLLEDFYESDDDFILLIDDDILFENTPGLKELFRMMQDTPDELSQVDAISGIDIPYKSEGFMKNLADLDLGHYLVFDPMPFKGIEGVLLLKNVKKYFDKEFYYEDVLCEDIIFRIDNLVEVKSYRCKNLQYKSTCTGEFSTFGFKSIQEQRDYYRDRIFRIFNERNVRRIEGKRDFKGFQKTPVEDVLLLGY